MRSFLALAPATALVALTVSACSSSSGGGASASGADAAIGCSTYPHIQSYTADMGQMGKSGVFRFVIVDASPAPVTPDNESWTVKIEDASGAAVTDATFPPMNGAIVNPRAWMPQMSHGGTVGPLTNNHDGTYAVTFDLYMEGVWEIDLAVQSGEKTDSTSFLFCMQ
jgi:hypothetical protein